MLLSSLDEACAQLQSDIAADAVPDVLSMTPQDQKAMELVHQAELAEECGELDQARILYQKVMRTSPKVAEFLGL